MTQGGWKANGIADKKQTKTILFLKSCASSYCMHINTHELHELTAQKYELIILAFHEIVHK